MTRDDGGQALVEFALVLPVILLLLFGLLQFALVLNARQTVAYAAQAAANGYAQSLVRRDADAAAAGAAAQLRPSLGGAARIEYRLIRGAAETVITNDRTGIFGDLVVARVTYEYPSPVRAGIGGFRFPDTLPVTMEAVARIESAGTGAAGAPGPSPTPRPAAQPTPAPSPRPTATPAASPSPTPAPAARSVRLCTFGGTSASVVVRLYGAPMDQQPAFTVDGAVVYRTELIPGRVLYWDRPGGGEDFWEGTDYATRNGWHVLAAQIPGYAPVVSIYDRADGRNWRCTSATIAPR